MEDSAFQSAKHAMMSLIGISKDALHVYVGLGVMLTAALVLKKPLRSPLPWLLALAAALAGELWDGFDDLRALGRLRWDASLHDILNTIFWPTILLLLARSGLISADAPGPRSGS